MTETEKKYDAIRRAYPETISKEQFYRIAHISKATAALQFIVGVMPRSSLASKFQESLLFQKSVLRSFLYRHTHAAYKENLGDIYCSFRLS